MKRPSRQGLAIAWSAVLLLGPAISAQSQSAPPLDVSAYRDYFLEHQRMTSVDLLTDFDAGVFLRTAPVGFLSSDFATEADALFRFSEDEIELIEKNGFAVSQRLSYPSFGHAFVDVFVNDLPVYVSADAILHAIHMSYDNILQDIERDLLIPLLRSALTRMHDGLPSLAAKYASEPEMSQMLRDVEVYLAVPMSLLGLHVNPVFGENAATITELLGYVEDEAPVSTRLFADTPRNVDFSQFTPRGHYADDPELTKYFQAMMWIGRVELYLIPPKNTVPLPTDADIRRQIVITKLIEELASIPPAAVAIDEIDRILLTMVGDSDNVTLANVRSVFDESGVATADQLLEEAVWKDFQARLAEKPFAFQKILSQILISADPDDSQIESAAAFLLLGQRFIIDSYVTGSVVFDKIKYQDKNVLRMMPSTLDVLFAIGNDAAAQFLTDELDTYHYAPYLASLRYLIDSYDDAFWSRSMYNGWLNAIRQLNPPDDRSALPAFMQTAHWWQKSMTTQLASWAQLRHDNLLYAKPSYTGGLGCLFPESFVEPIPEFYGAVRSFAAQAAASLSAVLPGDAPVREGALAYFMGTASTMDTLQAIARKELDGVPISDEERVFLGDMLVEMKDYAFNYYEGWYPRLYYRNHNEVSGEYSSGDLFREDLIVADVHTQPTDEAGNPVGKVLHVGTGPVNMAIIVTTLPGGAETTFVGPVMSYYEHISLNFKRLTDEEWVTTYDQAPSFRPEFANPYLADRQGLAMPGGLLLATDVEPASEIPHATEGTLLAPNYPNPFRETTTIRFRMPSGTGIESVRITVYNVNGQVVRRLVDEGLGPGAYSVRWDGTTDAGNLAPSGIYAYVLEGGGRREQRMMSYIK